MAKCISQYSGTENRGKEKVIIINYLIGKGLTVNQVAGIMGNLQQENGFDPTTEHTDTNGKISSGICQWNGGRSEKLKEFAKQNGKDWKDLGLQLDYLWTELNGDYKSVLNWFTANPNATVKDSVAKFEQGFEHCSQCNRAARNQYADEALEFYNKYANAECAVAINPTLDGSTTTDGSGGTTLLTDTTELSNKCGIKVQVNATVVNNGNNGDGNGTSGDSGATNTVLTTEKSLKLRLERSYTPWAEVFNTPFIKSKWSQIPREKRQTIGDLYYVKEDGTKERICYIIEDMLIYDENCNCVDRQNSSGYGDNVDYISGFKNTGWQQIAPVRYGKYNLTAVPVGSKGSASDYDKTNKKCPDEANEGPGHKKRYCYCNHWTHSAYNGKLVVLSSPGGSGCKDCKGGRSRKELLIHASPENKYGSENNSAGCLVVGTTICSEGNHKYLSGTHDALFKLYDNFIWPVISNGGTVELEIPYPQSMSKCADGFTF